MRTAAVAFVSSAFVSIVLTPVVRDLAHRYGRLDHGLSSRKLHATPTPRLGGVAIMFAFLAPLISLFFVDSEVGRRIWADREAALALIVGGLAIAGLGVWDDLAGCKPRMKLAVQFSVAGLMYLAGFRIDHLSIPLAGPQDIGLFSLPLTMIWIAGVINAVNLIDGLDGLAGGVALIAVATIFSLAALRSEPLMLLYTAALGGAILGFLFYNFNPATIFMGDSGSMFLGFVLAVTSIRTSSKSTTAVAISVPILALGIPIADTLLAIVRRALRGAPLFSADRGHIHHRLLDLGLSHRNAVLAIYGAAVLFGASALLLAFANSWQAALVLAALGVFSFFSLRALGFMDMKKARLTMEDRRRNLDLHASLSRCRESLRQARTFDEMWSVVRDLAAAMGASGVQLALLPPSGNREVLAWSEGMTALPDSALRVSYGLVPERHGEDKLELAWLDGRTAIHRDTEIAIELLCEHIVGAAERIGRNVPSGSAAPPAESR